MKCKVSILGEPNVGKSSITNKLVGEDVSIVTDLHGTTRDQIVGYVEDLEIIDTPGMLKGSTLMDKHMRKSISHAVANADILLYVLDATRFDERDVKKIGNYRDKGLPVIVAVNKVDAVKPEKLVAGLTLLNGLDFVKSVIPCSVRTGYNIDVLKSELQKYKTSSCTDCGCDDIYTNQSVKQMAEEIIRGAVIINTRDEIPHGVIVSITKFIETSSCVEIHADIICERKSHKPIIIGSGGSVLKKIGIQSRKKIENLVGVQVKLYTCVIVRENWKNNNDIVRSPFA